MNIALLLPSEARAVAAENATAELEAQLGETMASLDRHQRDLAALQAALATARAAQTAQEKGKRLRSDKQGGDGWLDFA